MSLTRREFLASAAAVGASTVLPTFALAKPKSTRITKVTSLPLKSAFIQVYCLGSDEDPASSEDLRQAMKWIAEKSKQTIFSDCWHKMVQPTLMQGYKGVFGRIPIERSSKDYAPNGYLSSTQRRTWRRSLRPSTIQCHYYTVQREGHGYLEVRIGSDNRPAQLEDLRDARRVLAEALDDPDLSIVTHHNFAMRWFETGFPMDLNAVVIPHNWQPTLQRFHLVGTHLSVVTEKGYDYNNRIGLAM